MAKAKRSTTKAGSIPRGPSSVFKVLKKGEPVPPGYAGIPVSRAIDMHNGTPYTPADHRAWFSNDAGKIPLRLLTVGIAEKGGLPRADFKLSNGKPCGMMFTNEWQVLDPILAALPKAHKIRLAKHVSKALIGSQSKR